MSVSVPLGSRKRSAYSVSEVDHELSALSARRQAQAVELQQELFDIYQQLRQAQLEVESVRERQLPKAEAALKQSRRGGPILLSGAGPGAEDPVRPSRARS